MTHGGRRTPSAWILTRALEADAMTTEELIAGILDREGPQFVDDAADRGGPTRWGITILTAELYYGRPVPVEEIRTLARTEAAAIYRQCFVEQPGFLGITEDAVRVYIVDWAVHVGVGRAIRCLQALLRVSVDGICGPVTLAAINARAPAALLKECVRARMRHAIRVALERVPNDVIQRTDLKWLEGWWHRIWSVGVLPL